MLPYYFLFFNHMIHFNIQLHLFLGTHYYLLPNEFKRETIHGKKK